MSQWQWESSFSMAMTSPNKNVEDTNKLFSEKKHNVFPQNPSFISTLIEIPWTHPEISPVRKATLIAFPSIFSI